MNLVDMKLPKKSEKELKKERGLEAVNYAEQDRWPYGLQLRFGTEQIAKMPGLKEYKVGDKVSLVAEATVTEVRMAETQDNKARYTVELQIEKVACTSKKPLSKMNPREYREAREGKK